MKCPAPPSVAAPPNSAHCSQLFEAPQSRVQSIKSAARRSSNLTTPFQERQAYDAARRQKCSIGHTV